MTYVHGYSTREARRLDDQAGTLAALLHAGTRYAPGERVLEAGCGVGAQTVHLVANSPGIQLTALDRSPESLAAARSRVDGVTFREGDIGDLPFAPASFDHVFVCFVLEHLPDPVAGLRALRTVLRPGGTITVIEGDHGSAYYWPRSAAAQATIDALVTVQHGDALMGRRVQPLLAAAGFTEVAARPCTVYADETRPELVDGFTRNTFIAMVAGVRDEALAAGLLTADAWDAGIADLERTAEPGGTFHYAFMKGVAVR